MSPAQRDRHECTFMRRTRAVNGNGRGRSEVRRDASTVAYLPIRRIDGNGFDRYQQVAPLPYRDRHPISTSDPASLIGSGLLYSAFMASANPRAKASCIVFITP